MTATTLQEIIARREAVLAERLEKTEAHTAYLLASAKELGGLQEAEALVVGGLDLAKIGRGRSILSIEGRLSETSLAADYMGADKARQSSVRLSALADAKADIAAGGVKIRQRYFGVKNYSGFGDQREDHEYGMGPRHGHIVFRIALRFKYPQVPAGIELTAEQIDDALYLLSALPKIEALTSAERAAA